MEDFENETTTGLKRSFADVAVTSENILDKLAEEAGGVAYYYRHKRSRDFRVGEFHFEEFLLTITDEKQHDRWLDTYSDLPLEERTQIVEYHPELAAQIERPVGSSQIVRGAMGTTMIPDAKTVQSGAGAGGFQGLIKR